MGKNEDGCAYLWFSSVHVKNWTKMAVPTCGSAVYTLRITAKTCRLTFYVLMCSKTNLALDKQVLSAGKTTESSKQARI
jgi:hypothetical protein